MQYNQLVKYLLLAIWLLGCGSSAQASPKKSRTSGASKTINKRFLSPKLNVQKWQKRFEGESREVSVHRAAIVAALRLEAGMRVADIGAGTGLFESLFSKGVGPTGSVYAVDISPRFLEHLRKRKRREKWANVAIVAGEERTPKLAANSVDLVFICDTYHHFSDVPVMLAAIRQALRPTGRLVIIDFHRIPGKSKKWLLKHVRADMKTFKNEIIDAGFRFHRELKISGLKENYALEFSRGKAPNTP